MTTSSQVIERQLIGLAICHAIALGVRDPMERSLALLEVALGYLQVTRRALENYLELYKNLKEYITGGKG